MSNRHQHNQQQQHMQSLHHSSSENHSTAHKMVLNHRYVVESTLGKGRFGVVFLVDDLTYMQHGGEKLKVAKRIPLDTFSAEDLPKIHAEAQLLAKLSHPNIVAYYDSFSTKDNSFCIVTEYCDGGDLRSKIKQQKAGGGQPFEEKVIIDWFIQLMSAVEHLHEKNVLHRDISTGNVFLKGEKIKLGDFGCSRMLKSSVDVATSFIGTPLYMSPEVLNLQEYDSKADIWSCGCVLYEMCALDTLFTVQGVISLSIEVHKKLMPSLPAVYSSDLTRIFRCMVEREPSSRWSATNILHDSFIASRGMSITHRRRRRRIRRNNLSSQQSTTASSNNLSASFSSSSQWNTVDPETQQWFQDLDANKNGSINCDELQSALFKNSAACFTPQMTHIIFELFDINKDDTFDLREFAEIVDYIRQKRKEFESSAGTEDGTLNNQQFADAIVFNLGYKFSPEVIEKSVRKFGSQGLVSFDGYLIATAFFKVYDEKFNAYGNETVTFDQYISSCLTRL